MVTGRPTRRERRKPRVLIVDDDEAIRALAVRVLRHWGYIVVSASTVQEGLAGVDTWLPDVLVVDLELRDGRGQDLIERVQAQLGNEAPAILICTGSDLSGPNVLCKPFHAQELVEAVASAERSRHARREEHEQKQRGGKP